MSYLLQPKVEVLGLGQFLVFPEKPHRPQPKNQPSNSDRRDPDINEARRKVVSEGTQRPPALFVTA